MAFEFQTAYHMYFQATREDSWPVELPWPEWKPNTDKKYRPDRLNFTITWTDGLTKPRIPTLIYVQGPRILLSGKMGSEVQCSYYGDGIDKLPRALQELIHAGLREAWHVWGDDEPVAPTVPGKVP
jgi:hypothetical protein